MAAARRALNFYDVLKLVALVVMTLDHYAMFVSPDDVWLRVIGRTAAPIFLFLVGYNGSYRFRWPLLLAASVMTVVDGCLSGFWYPQNILWTIVLGRFVLGWIARKNIAPWAVLLACAIWSAPLLPVVDMSTLGWVWMLFGHAVRTAPGSHKALLYGTAGYVGAILYVVLIFDWNVTQNLAVVVLDAVVWCVLWRFTPRVLPRDSALLRFWSQQALIYYVLHKLVLQLIV